MSRYKPKKIPLWVAEREAQIRAEAARLLVTAIMEEREKWIDACNAIAIELDRKDDSAGKRMVRRIINYRVTEDRKP